MTTKDELDLVVYVADTHALVWYLEGSDRLSERAREALSSTDGEMPY